MRRRAARAARKRPGSLAACALTIAPWTLRNALVAGSPALVCFGGGLNFYYGHNSEGTGYRPIEQTPMARLRTQADIDREGYRLGLASLAQAPFGFVTRGVHKVAISLRLGELCAARQQRHPAARRLAARPGGGPAGGGAARAPARQERLPGWSLHAAREPAHRAAGRGRAAGPLLLAAADTRTAACRLALPRLDRRPRRLLGPAALPLSHGDSAGAARGLDAGPAAAGAPLAPWRGSSARRAPRRRLRLLPHRPFRRSSPGGRADQPYDDPIEVAAVECPRARARPITR